MSWVTPAVVDIHDETPTFAFSARFSVSVGSHGSESQQVHVSIRYKVVEPCLRKDEQAAVTVDPLVVQRGQLVDLVRQRVHIPHDYGGNRWFVAPTIIR